MISETHAWGYYMLIWSWVKTPMNRPFLRIGILQSENKVGWKFWRKGRWCLLIPPGNWVHDLLHVLMFWWLHDLSACWFRSVRFVHSVYYLIRLVLCEHSCFMFFCVSEIADYFPQPKTSLTHWLAWHTCCFLQANSQGTCATMLGLLPGKWMHVSLM